MTSPNSVKVYLQNVPLSVQYIISGTICTAHQLIIHLTIQLFINNGERT